MEKFALTHLAVPVGRVGQILEEIAEAVTDTRVALSAYIDEHQEFREVGERMLAAWDAGVSGTLSS